ncbi:MAG: 6-phosphofructokinase [Zunongwangia sp.]|uniref:ATP-dependent 6-phosphofructokinase n=1 Tax=Zunongwangia profunda (strain DSM 18752 / CCTCC AB 206139 / SM-A87) TaxID=655815 RepID=D5BFW0_ZUNPS|nr:6-phosphofructokinase [Zunongwangia profunda]ADF53073.1 6-phosphofructokinase [Zunongwangia profunda SM-A87]MAO37332.1 6-phosphofructokinase [Zunongwangia sp.]MAS71930.1 6-phosphofructokinase [Zunongwangia sp.]|tara:strand:+ start:2160 stop:3146 length:987 start_codon:yes stop_codon:yes gene_type:complete
MSKKIKRIGVITSGGDAPGMNAAIRAVVRACSYYHISCYGFYNGYNGLINGNFEELDARSVRNIINLGGTFLKSARSKEFRTKEGREKAYKVLKKEQVDGLILIGGDGTFTGGQIFSREYDIPVIGVPGTIDNDIYGTSHTIGYDTALNTVVEAIDKIRDTASSHDRLFFIEVMGRDAGFIALNTGIGAGAEEILIPEENLGLDRLLDSLEKSRRSGKNSSIVIVSEGDKIGKNVFQLADYVKENLPYYDAKVTVLGHIQRGGIPSCFDRVLASRMSVKAVELLLDGQKNVMVGLKDDDIITCPLDDVIHEKPKINKDLLRISEILST